MSMFPGTVPLGTFIVTCPVTFDALADDATLGPLQIDVVTLAELPKPKPPVACFESLTEAFTTPERQIEPNGVPERRIEALQAFPSPTDPLFRWVSSSCPLALGWRVKVPVAL